MNTQWYVKAGNYKEATDGKACFTQLFFTNSAEITLQESLKSKVLIKSRERQIITDNQGYQISNYQRPGLSLFCSLSVTHAVFCSIWFSSLEARSQSQLWHWPDSVWQLQQQLLDASCLTLPQPSLEADTLALSSRGEINPSNMTRVTGVSKAFTKVYYLCSIPNKAHLLVALLRQQLKRYDRVKKRGAKRCFFFFFCYTLCYPS